MSRRNALAPDRVEEAGRAAVAAQRKPGPAGKDGAMVRGSLLPLHPRDPAEERKAAVTVAWFGMGEGWGHPEILDVLDRLGLLPEPEPEPAVTAKAPAPAVKPQSRREMPAADRGPGAPVAVGPVVLIGDGYRFRKYEGWNPAEGIHLNPLVAREEKRQAPPSASSPKSEKLAVYFDCRDAGFTLAEAAEYTGIAVSTAEKYERDYQAARDGVPAGGGS